MMTREAFEAHLDCLIAAHGFVAENTWIESLLAHDAALRQQLEAVRTENSLMAAHQGIDNYQRYLDTIDQLRTELAAVREDNGKKFLQIRKMESDCFEHCQDWTRAQMKLNEVTKQLAEAQAGKELLDGHRD